MSIILTKLSEPGWEKKFSVVEEARDELAKYVCFQCECEYGVTKNSPVEDLMNTTCGCEFWLETDESNP